MIRIGTAWLCLALLGASHALRAESIPVASLDAQGGSQITYVTRQNYVDGLAAMMKSVESESHSAIEQAACPEKLWELTSLSVGVGLSAEVGFPPFFELGFAPRFSLNFGRDISVNPNPPSHCPSPQGNVATLGDYLQDRIVSYSSNLENSTYEPTLGTDDEAWLFNGFYLGIAPEITFTVAVVSLSVTPSLNLGWLRKMPDGWVPYQPAGS